MAFCSRKKWFTYLILVFTILAACRVEVGAMRPLVKLQLQSLQRGPVQGSGHNPCTQIPGRETGVCKLGGMNIAGKVMHTPTPRTALPGPAIVAQFGVASNAKKKSS